MKSDRWPLERILRWMRDHGERVELNWHIDTNKWTCLWSTHDTTKLGEGREPHQAAIDALIEGQS